MSQLTEFINNDLYPTLFERIDTAFPSFEFVKRGGVWYSKFHLDGTRSTKGSTRTRVEAKNPNRAFPIDGDGSGYDSRGVDLITLYRNINGLSNDIEAVRALAKICGLELPSMEDSESYRAYKEKQAKLEEYAQQMEAALFHPEGRATLSYLRDTRGYSDEFIKWAHFGHCGEETGAKIKELLTYKDRNGEQRSPYYGIGRTHSLFVPYRTGGNIQGYVFRTTEKDTQPKYVDAFISAAASKKFHLFGLSVLSPIDAEKWSRTIVVVEGELDALRAQFVGLSNVVAASGGQLSKEKLEEAKKYGATGVTLLFDTEQTVAHAIEVAEAADITADTKKIAESAQRTLNDSRAKIKGAIELIAQAGLTPFVAHLPQGEQGEKVDVDSYLRGHSAEDLKGVIAGAHTAARYYFDVLTAEALSRSNGEPLTDAEFDTYKRKVIALSNRADIVSPTERASLFKDFEATTGERISKEAIEEEANRLKALQDASRQQSALTSLLAEANSLNQTGRPEDRERALSMVEAALPKLRGISREAEFSKLLSLPTEKSLRSGLASHPSGVATSYAFGSLGRREQLLLPSGALTFVCAPTSHGKSRFLENLALQQATNEEEGDTLYFSFEEDAEAVKLQFLNMFVGATLSRNNLRTLTGGYREGEPTKYMNHDTGTLTTFNEKEPQFLSLLTSGKLRVYSEAYDSRALKEAIKYLSKAIKVKAVFVDYIQLLHTTGGPQDRKRELAEMCKEFMGLAKETGLPIVFAAQLNREAYSPIEMAAQNIAEASEIEHSANTIIALWNSSVSPLPKSGYFYTQKGGEPKLSSEAKKIADRGFNIGTGGQMYAKLVKNRGGERNLDAVLSFDGNTGLITQPDYSPSAEADGSALQDFASVQIDDADKDEYNDDI